MTVTSDASDCVSVCVCVGEGLMSAEVAIHCSYDYIIVDDVCCHCGEDEAKVVRVCELSKWSCVHSVLCGVRDDVKEKVRSDERECSANVEADVHSVLVLLLAVVTPDYSHVESLFDIVV